MELNFVYGVFTLHKINNTIQLNLVIFRHFFGW